MSKRISEYLSRLIQNGFLFEDDTFDVLYSKYPNCKVALKWWCCEWGKDSKFNITYNQYLKEFIISNPPSFNISAKCCDYAKKKVIHKVISNLGCDLNIFGVRKAEGGTRATAYKNCYTQGENTYRPLFWFKDEDKREYERAFDITHSDCYEKWGLARTGCVGCPYGKHLSTELDIVRQFEPNMYKAVNKVFKDSYEYTRQYRKFVREMKDKEKGRRRLF